MVGLMTLWFGPFIEIEPAHGYFHLCPSCYDECVAPELEDVQQTLARLHPTASAFLESDGYLETPEPEAPPPATGAPDRERDTPPDEPPDAEPAEDAAEPDAR